MSMNFVCVTSTSDASRYVIHVGIKDKT